ncbi:hypothetical protein ACSBM8_08595 [Sphingomonas sp. ASY06-1R]|uniref:hypothetical protein n=1 Tax=Sphingomonas sp. ASY06-1R TaxID=3445771 RepID=UPI003FA30908
MTQAPKPVAILGGLGKTGRRVADRLRHLGLPIRSLSRSIVPAFDWDDPRGWEEAVAGAGQAYLTFQPDLSVPGAAERIGRLASIARAQNLQRVVLLSGRGEPGALRAEQALANAGIPWAVIRSSWFAQNFSESFLAEAIAHGNLVIPCRTAAEPFVDVEDIADVAIALLTGTTTDHRVYEVTGPALLRFPDACTILSRSMGRVIACHEIDEAAFADHLRGNGLPEDMVAMMMDLFTATLDGRTAAWRMELKRRWDDRRDRSKRMPPV